MSSNTYNIGNSGTVNLHNLNFAEGRGFESPNPIFKRNKCGPNCACNVNCVAKLATDQNGECPADDYPNGDNLYSQCHEQQGNFWKCPYTYHDGIVQIASNSYHHSVRITGERNDKNKDAGPGSVSGVCSKSATTHKYSDIYVLIPPSPPPPSAPP
jgi:hypothetical protein